MEKTINAKELRASLPELVVRLRRGERFLVLYRSRPAFRLVPVDASEAELAPLEHEPLYKAKALGRSTDGLSSRDHDAILYGARRR
jgi:antitoxin (DNA-binding transcriptional repressor) of toxin-antitoxin stability system